MKVPPTRAVPASLGEIRVVSLRSLDYMIGEQEIKDCDG